MIRNLVIVLICIIFIYTIYKSLLISEAKVYKLHETDTTTNSVYGTDLVRTGMRTYMFWLNITHLPNMDDETGAVIFRHFKKDESFPAGNAHTTKDGDLLMYINKHGFITLVYDNAGAKEMEITTHKFPMQKDILVTIIIDNDDIKIYYNFENVKHTKLSGMAGYIAVGDADENQGKIILGNAAAQEPADDTKRLCPPIWAPGQGYIRDFEYYSTKVLGLKDIKFKYNSDGGGNNYQSNSYSINSEFTKNNNIVSSNSFTFT
tara:strand:- start:257 stop:1042 length:786 start_codon:yes stop_codon:yes gene_type:complete